ncbi:MAG: glutamate dehydrogenase, partial [Puniceicoccales bacterium]
EWKQNRQAETWDEFLVDQRLQKVMQESAERVLRTAERFQCSMRLASYAAAIEHIEQVYAVRGFFP